MIKRLKGTQDLLPEETVYWQAIERSWRRVFDIFGYSEIRTPIIEETSLFSRSVGTESDIVKKQMYSFDDQGGRSICLRPEQTASVCRAYIENQLDKTQGFVKFYYMGPMFRSERPQHGRFRQFHQTGVEVIGSYSAYIDADIMILADRLFKDIGIKSHIFKVNSLGCDKDKAGIKTKLKKFLKPHLGSLCADCVVRYERNILRTLDCKMPDCRKILETIQLDDTLCPECKRGFDLIRQILDNAGVKYIVDPMLVRGLDYYTGCVFEVIGRDLGAQDAICAGGRYDNLISDLGASPQGAAGFAIGMERVISSLANVNIALGLTDTKCNVFIAALGENAREKAYGILCGLRKAGISCEMDYLDRSFKSQMRYADKIGASSVIIIGDNEIEKGICIIKDMAGGSQQEELLENIVPKLKQLKGNK